MTAASENPNPFAGTPQPALDAMERMLGLLKGDSLADISEASDEIEDYLHRWRLARGEAGMQGWFWTIKGRDEEGFHGEYPTRSAALADVTQRIEAGCIDAPDGMITVCEARNWADSFDEGAEFYLFAAQRNEQTLHVSALDAVAP